MSRIFIQGQGAVSPAGWSAPALWASLEARQPLPVQSLARPGWQKPLPVRAVPPPEERPAFQAHARLRRASPMAHYFVGAALEALGEDAQLVRSGGLRLGIVSCTMNGGISYSRRFYEEVMAEPATASPMIFPETVFNSPASHLAAYLGCSALNYALVGDAGTFLQGLALAANWMADGSVEACLVIGAEESDWTAADALRLFDRNSILASGAGAIYLKKQPPVAAPVELIAVTDSFAASGISGRAGAARDMRGQLPACAPHEVLCSSEAGNAAWNDWSEPELTPKTVLGEGFAASAAWQCVAACEALRRCQYAGANVSVTGRHLRAVGARFTNPNF